MSKSVLPMFSSRSFKPFMSYIYCLIDFEFIFIHGVRRCSLSLKKKHVSILIFAIFIYLVLLLAVVVLQCHMGSL